MIEEKTSLSSEEIKKLLEKNIELSEQILVLTTKTRRYIFWQQVYDAFKFLVIIVPLVIGIFYLPPLLKNAFSQYSSLMSGGNETQSLEQVSSQLLKKK